MKISNVMNCSFSAWYTKFKDHTIKSQIIPLPDQFIDYLLADQVVLPQETINAEMRPEDDIDIENRNEEDEIDWSSEDIFTPVAEAPSFPEFESLLRQTIKRLGDQVFPKLNWSAPRDATWISFDKTLKCTCASDVYLLLKSSDFITHDLTQPFDYCDDDENMKNEAAVKYELVLRKWQEINPACEFRCFVKNNKVIAISQRYTDMYFSYIQENSNEIIADIQSFFYHVVKDTFPDNTFCFDIYRRSQGKLLLLDFNPYGPVTDSLLFTWTELLQDEVHLQQQDQVPLLRCIEVPAGVRPSPYASYAMPRDLVDIASGEDPAKLMELLKIKTQAENRAAQSDSDDEDVQGPTT